MTAVSSEVQRITSGEGARRLAERLLAPGRIKPVVLITSVDAERPLLDPELVLEGVDSYADVFWMPNGDVTWAFSQAMPPMTQVYGDAGRVYAVNDRWQSEPRQSRLHMFASPERARLAQDSLIAEAMSAAFAAGLFARPQMTGLRQVTATVKGFPSVGRALVQGSFGFGYVRAEMTFTGVALESVLAKGMRVAGAFDDATKLLDITEWVSSADEALSTYEVGQVVPVRIRDVGTSVVLVELHPGKAVEIRAGQVTGNVDEDLRGLFTRGEVTEARVKRTGKWILSMHDIGEAEIVRPACSLVPEGPPWIEPVVEEAPGESVGDVPVAAAVLTSEVDVDEMTSVEDVVVAEAPRAVAPSPLMLDPRRRTRVPAPIHTSSDRPQPPRAQPAAPAIVAGQRDELARLRLLVEELEIEREKELGRIEKYKTEKRKLLARVKRPSQTTVVYDAFLDPEDQLRHEVYLEWVARIPASDKAARPLRDDWTFGSEFLDSLSERPAEIRSKVVAVMVEVLLDLVVGSSGRDLHRLRAGAGGDAGYIERSPGEHCWRCAVQKNTPGAPRIHYWKLGTSIEFSRVGHHDDMRP